jgi:branched-chain amino acid transport system substrate-binding protein
MLNGIEQAGGTPDLFSPDGFTAALMIVHAIEASDSNTSAMATALEGWTFAGPKGQEQIRASDHALLQPMFQATLTGSGAAAQPKLLAALSSDQVAPPAKTMAG